MHSLSLELAGISNDIARTMAEAAAASLLAAPALEPPPPPTQPLLPEELSASAPDEATPPSEPAGDDGVAVQLNLLEGGDGGGRGGGGDGGGRRGVGRSRAEAQKEVDRLKARQSELFELIQLKREVMFIEAHARAWGQACARARGGG